MNCPYCPDIPLTFNEPIYNTKWDSDRIQGAHCPKCKAFTSLKEYTDQHNMSLFDVILNNQLDKQYQIFYFAAEDVTKVEFVDATEKYSELLFTLPGKAITPHNALTRLPLLLTFL